MTSQANPSGPASGPATWSAGVEPVPGYTLQRILGTGGMGEVWEAHGPGGVPVALKRVPIEDGTGQRELQALELLKHVHHPHLLALHGYWVRDQLLVMAWELAEDSLASLLRRQHQSGAAGLPREQVLTYLRDAAEALDYLGRPVHRVNSHTTPIQHRDVKPANLLLQGGAIKVADFGLAKALEGIVRKESFSMTAAYAPPEFFHGQTTPASDQYSLGITYYELRTGRLPFTGALVDMMHGHLEREPDLQGLTDSERTIVARALAKDPRKRWAGCVKFIGEIERSCAAPESPPMASGGAAPPAGHEAPTATYHGQAVTTGLLLVAGELVPLPLRRTEVRAAITAGCAEVTVEQMFVNTHSRAIEATYVFPLPEDAAVHRLRMQVGDRRIEGVVREKEEARQTYQEARQEGHGAALVEQTTPNIFTTSVANILPNQEVRIEIAYLQPLPFEEGRYRFVFPMVVSPRYVLGSAPHAEPLVQQVPAAITEPRLPQGLLRGDTVSIEVDLDAGVPLCGFDSPSHDIEILAEEGASRVRIQLRRTDEIPNRDFVLNYQAAGRRPEHALFHEPGRHGEPGTFLLITTPPLRQYCTGVPREVIFVVDRSGSMNGEPLQQACQAAQQLLDRLEPEDAFNIVAFSDAPTVLADTPMPAEEGSLRRARSFLQGLRAGGGTEMLEPLRLALRMPPAPGPHRVRMIAFLTDGSVHGERELLAALRSDIGKTRIVGFGIGTAVNRHLLNKLTAPGRGFAVFLFPGENIARAVDRTLRRLGHAVLTDVELESGGGGVDNVLPERCPDVYRSQPLVVLGRYRGQSPPQLTLHGQLGGQPYTITVTGLQAHRHEAGVPLASLWARQRIEQLMDAIWEHPHRERELRKQVIQLAQQYNLASAYTSFLAIDYRTQAEREQAQDATTVAIPQYLPEGMPGAVAPAASRSLLDQILSSPASSVVERDRMMIEELRVDPEQVNKLRRELESLPPLSENQPAPERASVQDRVARIRPPRVHMTYTIWAGAAKEVELPFVIGVLADFSVNPIGPIPRLSDRKFFHIDRDNFDEILKSMKPGLNIRVENTLQGDGSEMAVQLKFESMEDFEPARIVGQVEPLRKLLVARNKLRDLLAKVDRSEKLAFMLEQILQDPGQLTEASTIRLHESLDQPEGPERDRMDQLVQAMITEAMQGALKFDKSVTKSIATWIKAIDERLSKQLAVILHHPVLQKLEGTWRGLNYLVMNSETGALLKIKVLNISKRELFRDLDRAIEFDQSQIFKKIYENEFGMPGGQPYGALIGDYEFGNESEDITLLMRMSAVAATAFCPFIVAAAPAFFGFSRWTDLAKSIELEAILAAVEYTKWDSFRKTPDARYVVLTLPRVLARLPYGANTKPTKEFGFEEFPLDSQGRPLHGPHEHYTWINTAYVLGARITDSFAKYGACTAICGAENGGRVENLPTYVFQSDDGDADLNCPTEIGITDRRENELARCGFFPLAHEKNSDYALFVGAQTTYKVQRHSSAEATRDAEISARLPYVLVTSRIIHYLMVVVWDKIGRFLEASDCEDWLNRWLKRYVNTAPNPDQAMRARYPLREAKIVVEAIPGKPGLYKAQAFLRPWLQMEELTAALSTVVRLPTPLCN